MTLPADTGDIAFQTKTDFEDKLCCHTLESQTMDCPEFLNKNSNVPKVNSKGKY